MFRKFNFQFIILNYASGLLFFCLSLFSLGSLRAQNLIPNSDFEKYTDCPNGQGTFDQKILVDWFAPVEETSPDYFNSCGIPGNNGIPENMMGWQKANSANGYVGLWAYVPRINYREFISCRLMQKLEKGKTYSLKFYISLSNESSYFLSHLDYAFTEYAPYTTDARTYMLLKSNSFSTLSNMKDTTNWMELTSEYYANGNEEYFTMGFFEFGVMKESVQKLDYKPKGSFIVWKGAYYYIDSLTLQEKIIEEIPKDTIPKQDTVLQEVFKDAKKGFVLDRVYFDIDKWDIKETSFSQLDSVVLYMNLFPDISIEVSGHTDSTASVVHNETLSKNRALAVRKYLIEKGIDEKRITAVGYASTKPRATNKTPEGRTLNRRVEFMVKEE